MPYFFNDCTTLYTDQTVLQECFGGHKRGQGRTQMAVSLQTPKKEIRNA